MTRRIHLAACVLLVLSAACAHAQDIGRFVTIVPGDLPVILSAPHGGRDPMPGVAERRRPGPDEARKFAAWGGFVSGAGDLGTLEIAERTAARLKERFGKAPYLVVNRTQRRYVDMNRPAELAYDPPGTDGPKIAHDAYHRALAQMRDEVARRFGRGIVLDIHGQDAEKGTLFRGTSDGRSVAYLLRTDGRAALDGPASVFGQLAARGYPVVPPIGADGPEDRRYNGGFTSWTYGSRTGGTVDAIQLEFGTDFRAAARRARTADDLAEAVAAFAAAYLPRAAR